MPVTGVGEVEACEVVASVTGMSWLFLLGILENHEVVKVVVVVVTFI